MKLMRDNELKEKYRGKKNYQNLGAVQTVRSLDCSLEIHYLDQFEKQFEIYSFYLLKVKKIEKYHNIDQDVIYI